MIDQLAKAIQFDRRPLCIALAYIVIANVALYMVGAKQPSGSSIWLNAFIYLSCILVWLTGKYLWVLFTTRDESAIFHSLAFLRTQRDTALRSIPIFALLIVYLPTFSAIKASIYRFNDYSWDKTFIAWDHSIHGNDPWILLQPYLGFPLITYIINLAYQFWLFLIYGGLLLFMFRFSDAKLREQFLIVFFASWAFIGTALAIMFASVGPCFVEPLFGIDRFTPQIEYLRSVDLHYPILADNTQQLLLERYRNRNSELGAGITAMPSMHVALACLFWLAARRVSKVAGYLGFAFLTTIMLGSVHLAWHYAVDGYVSIILIVALWKFAGYWVNHSHSSQV